MPRITKRKYTRRARKPRRRYRRKVMGKYLPLGGMPKSKLVKLRYAHTISMNPTIGTVAQQLFAANDIHDPYRSGVGHQPSNHDRWSAFFDRYCVLGSKCTVYPVHTTTSSVTPGTLMLCLSEDGTTITTAHGAGGIDNLIEQPRLKVSMKSVGMNQSSGLGKLVKTFSAKKFFGGSVVNKADWAGDFGASPSEGAFFEVAFASADNYNDPGSMTFRVVIDYIVLLTEPKLADAS